MTKGNFQEKPLAHLEFLENREVYYREEQYAIETFQRKTLRYLTGTDEYQEFSGKSRLCIKAKKSYIYAGRGHFPSTRRLEVLQDKR